MNKYGIRVVLFQSRAGDRLIITQQVFLEINKVGCGNHDPIRVRRFVIRERADYLVKILTESCINIFRV